MGLSTSRAPKAVGARSTQVPADMFRRIAATGAREALRARLPAAGKRLPLAVQQPAVQSFHAGLPKREYALEKPLSRAEEIEKYKNAPLFDMPRVQKFIDDYKMDDPKRYLPLALFLSVPAISREWYIVNEETMLMGCFFLFLGAVIDFGGASIAQYLDDQTKSILETHNKLEEVQVKVVNSELETNKARLEELDDVQAIYDIMCYAEQRHAEAMTLMEKHRHRELTVKMLEAFKAGRSKRIAELRAGEVEKALEEVAAKIASDKKLKKAALDNALAGLADPQAAAKVDPVSQMFAQYWKENGVNMDKMKDQAVPMTPEMKEKSEADLRAIYAKFAEDPSEAIAAIPDTYKPSEPNVLY